MALLLKTHRGKHIRVADAPLSMAYDKEGSTLQIAFAGNGSPGSPITKMWRLVMPREEFAGLFVYIAKLAQDHPELLLPIEPKKDPPK